MFDASFNLEELILPYVDGQMEDEGYLYTYDAAGNRLTETDPLGYVTSYDYNALNQLELITQPGKKDRS